MIEKLRGRGQAKLRVRPQIVLGAAFGLLAVSAPAWAQGYPPAPIPAAPSQSAPTPQTPYQPAPNQAPPNQPTSNLAPASPICATLQNQLASFDQGAPDTGHADQIKRSEDAIAKQQADLDRTVAQAHKAGCAGQGFFALFSALSPQCGPITSQIQAMRGNLDRMMSDLEQLKSGSSGRDDQRRALIGQLAQNKCGAQYIAAANAQGGPQGFFDALFGGGTILNANGDGAPNGTYHTVCVRTCDGYYFPLSYSTLPSHFAEDERTCQRECPAAEVALYSYRNPGEDMDQAVSSNGQLYTALPTAYRYRTTLIAGCSCRRPGQSWADALKGADDSNTMESGDIVVTDQNAKALSQAPKPAGKPAAGASQPAAGATVATTPSAGAASPDTAKRVVRVVGEPFLSSSQSPPQSPTTPQSPKPQ